MIKQLQKFLKSDYWLRRYCIFSGGVFYFEPPCRFSAPGRKSNKVHARTCSRDRHSQRNSLGGSSDAASGFQSTVTACCCAGVDGPGGAEAAAAAAERHADGDVTVSSCADNAPAAPYWLRRVPDDGERRDWTSPRARGAGGGACNAPVHCFKQGIAPAAARRYAPADSSRNVRRILVRGVSAPLPPEAKKISKI